ncbi:MAG: MerR family transcriptional regulator [Ruminococcus sp.]
MKRITIGEFCKTAGIPPSKLRYYESLGLIRPAMIDKENNYHYYSYEQYAEIEIIQICRKLNFPLKQIKKIQESKDLPALLHLIAKQKFASRKKLLQQQEIHQNLEWLNQIWEQEYALRQESDIQPQMLILPERKVLMAQIPENQSIQSVEKQDAYLQYQLSQKVVSELLAVNSIQRTYGYELKKDTLQNKKLSLTGKFVELPQYVMNMEPKLCTIPSGKYLTLPVQAFSETDWMETAISTLESLHLQAKALYLTEVALHLISRKDAFYYLQILIEPDHSSIR